MRDDLLTALAELTTTVIDSADGSVERWMEANERSVARVSAMFTEIRRAESYDLTTLSVALRQLRNLALTSGDPLTQVRLAGVVPSSDRALASASIDRHM